ncbi:hypothetical protein GPJ56_003670 [Histomonas meleagridis]|uniref:uncharacterized protein n=1 Tax=Histomonas meleagridis TaxID=135588 RepID=UPI00355A0985|nr:hypothetical protein GPJ56_003670 [Histomonas meleagridis]KAH0806245.1 hypothetical protein GO595_000933 [Histomonas meleagridis]
MTKKQTNTMDSINAILKEIREEEQVVTEENLYLKKLEQIQNSLLNSQREQLTQVAKLSSELAEVEDKRKALQEQLLSQKAKLLISASESADASGIIEHALQNSEQTPIGSQKIGEKTLSFIEIIQKSVFKITESCLKSDDLTASESDLKGLILKLNDLISNAVETGEIKEAPEDTARRQSYVISTLYSHEDDE